MGVSNPNIKFTYRDYCLLPEEKRSELIGGEFYLTPSPTVKHQLVAQKIEQLLIKFVQEHNLGTILDSPMDVVFSDHDVVQPDILFISNERSAIITEPNIQGAPDLIVEVLSPSTAERDLELKLKLYGKHGVREYWIVDPGELSIQVFLHADGQELKKQGEYTAGHLFDSQVLQGFSLNVDEIEV